MQDLLKLSSRSSVTGSSPSQLVFAQYMSNIIQQAPHASGLAVLDGASNAQVSFFFKDPNTDEVNAGLYNAMIAPRIQGMGAVHGTKQVQALPSTFLNAYNQLYLSLRYQLSPKDEATLQAMVAKVSGEVKKLVPAWNAWVKAFGKNATPPIPELDTKDMRVALVQMTGTMQVNWLNPEFEDQLKEDASYPYNHLNDFDKIFNQIPLTVPATTRDMIKNVYSMQGQAGGISAKVADATQTITGIRKNVQSPSEESGGMLLSGTSQLVPGVIFEPDDPLTLVSLLSADPLDTLTYSAHITKSESTKMNFEVEGESSISIPVFSFFSVEASGGAKSSIFESNFAGSKFSVEVVVNNPTTQPALVMRPLLYNTSTNQGWLNADPITQALQNGSNTEVSGYVFDGGVPQFNFAEGGDLGYIETLVLSQFLELRMTFEECESNSVRKYFEQHAEAAVSFLGIKLGSASESSSHQYDYDESSSSKITVTMRPAKPGYVPGGTDINQSLCNVVAVGVKYPFAI
ncbi:MAG: hypothetical protein P1V81_13725 [Planctomycetota bacterium]|nr:hypothetical protein [Planctomycetota bacterium]